MNKNGIGREIAVNVGEDISSATTAEIILAHNKYSLTVGLTGGVTIPNVPLIVSPTVTYLANEYLFYLTKAGDVPFSGSWTGRAHIVLPSPAVNFFGDVDSFIVGE